jgi:hypothetical protein
MTKTHKKPGAFAPTEQLRRQVETLAAFGVPQEDICRMVINPNTGKPIAMQTLRRRFRRELDMGASKATARVVESLYRQAVGAPAQYDAQGRLIRAERAPVLAAAVFWMKTRAKFKELADPGPVDDKEAAAPPAPVDGLDHDV